jgi:hypothetical protein
MNRTVKIIVRISEALGYCSVLMNIYRHLICRVCRLNELTVSCLLSKLLVCRLNELTVSCLLSKLLVCRLCRRAYGTRGRPKYLTRQVGIVLIVDVFVAKTLSRLSLKACRINKASPDWILPTY